MTGERALASSGCDMILGSRSDEIEPALAIMKDVRTWLAANQIWHDVDGFCLPIKYGASFTAETAESSRST